MKLLSLILFSLFFTMQLINTSYAQSKSRKSKRNPTKMFKIKLVTKKNDGLARMYRKFAKEDAIIRKSTKMVGLTLKDKRNAKIKNWRRMKAGQTVVLHLDPKFIEVSKVRAFLKKQRAEKRKLAKKNQKKKKENTSLNHNIYYMASQGQFKQDDTDLGTAEFSQNSPVTLGYMYTFRPEKNNYSLSMSTYFSYLVATSSNISDDAKSVPMEIGTNLYYDHPFKIGESNHAVFTGFDYERFNTFNLEGVENRSELIFDQNSIFFFTLGYSKVLSFTSSFNLLMKLSFSQSVSSSRASGYSDETKSSEVYQGNKFLFFLATKIYGNWTMSFLVKQHTLTGPSAVSSLRIGLGTGYSF